jgi:hypothetical protein
LLFSQSGFGTSRKILGVNKLPGPTIFDGWCSIVVVFKDAALKVFGVADIIVASGQALQNVQVKRHG